MEKAENKIFSNEKFERIFGTFAIAKNVSVIYNAPHESFIVLMYNEVVRISILFRTNFNILYLGGWGV